MKANALFLVAHGSPDPDWRRPLEVLHAKLRERLPERMVALCYLSDPASLDEAVARAKQQGHRGAEVVAALLSPGGRHVKSDLPEWVSATGLRHPGFELRLRPGALGDDPEVIEALARAALKGL